ncbi:MAG TPA: S8 family serine peptidase [Candidatus Saccharimonadaceae bacterium]|nr:S8 family serine peptidase [Candidatus Saccharimonadaceae bacterium]
MRRLPPAPGLLVAFLVLLLALPIREAHAAAPHARPFRTTHALAPTPGRLLVVLDRGVEVGAGGTFAVRDAALASALEREGLTIERDLAPHLGAGRFLCLTSAAADFDPQAAAARLRATGRFRAVVPDVHLQVFDTVPNDPYVSTQWYVNDPGGDDVHLTHAWDVTHGSSAITIGIMDTGVDLTHPDLAAQIWTNAGEIPGNGIDDDGDGYIDDVHGWDFGNNDNDPEPEPMFDENGIDIAFHGTFVAGLAAAATNNGVGVAGAGWSCRIVPLKIADAAGNLTAAAIAPAFDYAAAHHLSVVNLSFGGPGDPGVPEYFQGLVDAANAAGVLCVAAAGNDGASTPSYPAACNNVLSVAATDENGLRASFSNWGSWVKVAAPGASMWGCIAQNYVVDDFSQVFYLYLFLWDGENPYMYGDGTSFACPLTSGVAGLVRAQFPSLTPLEILQQIVVTGDVVSYDHPIGPKVNAYRAVTTAPVSVPVGGAMPIALAAMPNPFVRGTVLRYALPSEARVTLRVFDCAGREVRVLEDGVLAAGPHEARWDGAGDGGATLGSGVYFAKLEGAGVSRAARLLLLH